MANTDMQWNDYAGGTLPEGTTHVQLDTGDVIDVAYYTGGAIRYFGPPPAPVKQAIPPILPADFADVAARCLAALLRGDPVTITHPEGYERLGLGIPLKRGQPTGGLTHEYRPIVILEWLADQIPKSY